MSHHHEDEFRLNTPEFEKLNKRLDRRNFLTKTTLGLGAAAIGSLLGAEKLFGSSPKAASENPANFEEEILKALPHIAPKAKRVVYLFMSGGPSQFETFDYKPKLIAMAGQNLPDSVRKGQRLTGMSANQSALPMVPSYYKFNQYGKSGTWISELMPYTAKVVDDLCVIKSINSEAINHDPAITFLQTGNQLPGRPSIGSWVSYGLGSDNQNLPAFIVLVSKNGSKDQPLYARLWGNGFFAFQTSGCTIQIRKRSGSVPQQPRRI